MGPKKKKSSKSKKIKETPKKECENKYVEEELPKTSKPLVKINDPVLAEKFLIEMRQMIETYHKDLNEFPEETTIFPEETKFKMDFYPQFEKLLIQVELVHDHNLRNGAILETYKWFKEKVEDYKKLNPISNITSKLSHIKCIDPNTITKSDIWSAKNYPLEFEKIHRSEVISYLPPKEK